MSEEVKKPRHPATIAGEMRAKIEAAPKFGVPVNLREGLDLCVEFMESVSSALLDAGVVQPVPVEGEGA